MYLFRMFLGITLCFSVPLNLLIYLLIQIPNTLLDVSLSHVSGDYSLFQCTIEPLNSYVCRITLTLSCTMDLRRFPMDYQRCSVQIESCKYNVVVLKSSTNDQMKLIGEI